MSNSEVKFSDQDQVIVEYDSMTHNLILDNVVLEFGKHEGVKMLGREAKKALAYVEPNLKEFDELCDAYSKKINSIQAKDEDERKNEVAELTFAKKLSPQARFYQNFDRDVKPLRFFRVVENLGPVKTVLSQTQEQTNALMTALLQLTENSKVDREALMVLLEKKK